MKEGYSSKQSINSRVSLLITHKGLNPNSFSVRIGKPAQTTNKIIKEVNKPSYDYLVAVISTFRDINPRWLLLGEGEMVENDGVLLEASKTNGGIDYMLIIRSQQDIIEHLQQEIRELENPIKIPHEKKKGVKAK